ncbi:ead/Ea22-like family protein [Salmonella enterica]|uniref:ead/Ea22-like family protein n=1 Tax=Salmonella enterica TaxID=28901 RepID=UPI00215B2BE4|nr:ead/Ea22-like family protein [Salmonella enterica]
MTALNKQALREAAMHAKTEDDWGCDADNFHDKATPDAVLALLDENYRLTAERDALRENIGGDNTRSAADIYFQLVEECEIPPGGSLVGYIDDIKERLGNAENYSSELDNALCELLPGTQYMDPPDGGSVTPLEQVRRMVAAYRNRIAELEARDEPKFVKCWSCKHDIEVLAIVDCDGYCPRCAAPIDLDDEPYAGIGVKGE